ncbi:MAG: hypothetical protein BWZ10_01365 [candidate division BRC1 bacterium ADurb.BinA364]|nr:MAG: hypothetical protein BWZ10_01365 [candidate division BRC1 bacterium ADurb.BinA364]
MHRAIYDRPDQGRRADGGEAQRILRIGFAQKQIDQAAADHHARGLNRAELPQPLAPAFRIAQRDGDRGVDRHHQVHARAGDDHHREHPAVRMAQHGHAEHPGGQRGRPDQPDARIGKHAQQAGHQHHQKPRRLARQFQKSAFAGGQLMRIAQKVVEDRFVNSRSGGQHADSQKENVDLLAAVHKAAISHPTDARTGERAPIGNDLKKPPWGLAARGSTENCPHGFRESRLEGQTYSEEKPNPHPMQFAGFRLRRPPEPICGRKIGRWRARQWATILSIENRSAGSACRESPEESQNLDPRRMSPRRGQLEAARHVRSLPDNSSPKRPCRAKRPWLGKRLARPRRPPCDIPFRS